MCFNKGGKNCGLSHHTTTYPSYYDLVHRPELTKTVFYVELDVLYNTNLSKNNFHKRILFTIENGFSRKPTLGPLSANLM